MNQIHSGKHVLRGNDFFRVVERRLLKKRSRERRRYMMLNDLIGSGSYEETIL